MVIKGRIHGELDIFEIRSNRMMKWVYKLGILEY